MRIYRSRVLIFVAAVFVNFFVIWHLRCPDEPNSSKKHSSKKPNHENPKINSKHKNEERHDENSEVKPEHKLAIIVPFRDRFDELLEFAPEMDKFLTESGVAHEIIVVNQADTFRFNRAALINAGYLYTVSQGDFDYMAMHDVDLIPTTHQIKYEFPEKGPVHIASPELHPKYHYPNYVGGILMLSLEHFRVCRGMSNKFWGWGREDDEFFLRMRDQKLSIQRPQGVTTGYNTFKHVHDKDRRPRDYKRIGEQKKEQFKRDPIGGFDTLRHAVVRIDSLLIGQSPVKILNVELECDEKITPWCRDSV